MLYCGLLLIPAAVLILVTGYVFQHARLAVVFPVIVAVMLVAKYPPLAVSLVLSLMFLGMARR